MMKLRKKTIILILLMMIVCGMGIGYSILSRELKIEGTATIDPNFDVAITNIERIDWITEMSYAPGMGASAPGFIENKAPTFTATTANFDVTFNKSNTTVAYIVKIKNQGDLPAIIDSVSVNKTGSGAVILDTPVNLDGAYIKSNGYGYNYLVVLSYDTSKEINEDDLKANIEIKINVKQALEEPETNVNNLPVYLTFDEYDGSNKIYMIPTYTWFGPGGSGEYLNVSIDGSEYISSLADWKSGKIVYNVPENLEVGNHTFKFKLRDFEKDISNEIVLKWIKCELVTK